MSFMMILKSFCNLAYIKIESMDGWGKQSVANLKYSIETSKNISFERFIYALGIRHIGFENAKLISRSLRSSENFLNLSNLSLISDDKKKVKKAESKK